MYLFAWETPVGGGRMLAHHALEITFAFDNVVKVPAMSGGGAGAATLADKMSDAWIVFARGGDPNNGKLPGWHAYEIGERATMVFDDVCEVVWDPHGAVSKLWGTV
jgi:para-nitrobenzyl esterase